MTRTNLPETPLRQRGKIVLLHEPLLQGIVIVLPAVALEEQPSQGVFAYQSVEVGGGQLGSEVEEDGVGEVAVAAGQGAGQAGGFLAQLDE